MASCRAQEQQVIKFFDPPTTHLFSNIEDLTDILEDAAEEHAEKDEEMSKFADSLQRDMAPSCTWHPASVQEFYMVDPTSFMASDEIFSIYVEINMATLAMTKIITYMCIF